MAFMERHPVIAKNYYKGDRLASEAAWKRLSKELNSVGPPVKEAGEWKRVSTAKIRSIEGILNKSNSYRFGRTGRAAFARRLQTTGWNPTQLERVLYIRIH